jgi:hypothetical protein
MVAMSVESGQDLLAMSAASSETLFDDLLDHLVRRTNLGRREALQLVGEVLAYFDETVEVFVRRRHGELQRRGLANPAIFEQVAKELQWWRVAAPMLTERQVRRIVYG